MKKTADKARENTDRELALMSRQISLLYKKDKGLLIVHKRYADYMAKVKSETQELYEASKTDDEAKKKYEAEVRKRTLESAEYRKLIDAITKEMARVNQRAVDFTNSKMAKVYAMNYNQVADECRRVGIKVERADNEK